MHPEQQQAILTIALLAAFADGANAEREREQIRRLAESLAETEGAPDLPALYQKVLLKQASLADTAAVLPDPSLRQLAYEMAVGVCDADGHANEAERRFLAELATVLGLEAAVTDPLRAEAEAMADLAESAAPRISTTLSTTIAATTPGKSAFSGGSGEWHVAQSWRDRGLPAPVRNLLAEAVDKASA